MEKSRCSLMTFTLDIDVAMKKMSVKECMLLAQNAEIPFVDVQHLSEKSFQAYRQAAQETGVKPCCYIVRVSFFSKTEDKIRRELEKHLRQAVVLGARLLMIVPLDVTKDEKVCAKLGKEQVRQKLKQHFAMAVQMAEGSGIRVCFETTPQDYSCLSGTEDCHWVLEQVPGLGLVYDTANMLPHGDDPIAYYEALKSYIVHTHVKDVITVKPTWKDRLIPGEWTKDGKIMKCCIFGEGVIPLKEILRRMEADGYTGAYAWEYCHPEKYPASYAQHTQRIQPHIAYWEALA